MSITNDPRPPLALRQQRGRYWLMRLLRVAPGPLFLACLIGGVLMLAGTFLGGSERRSDTFAVISSHVRSTHVVRLDLPDGWRVESRPRKTGYATGLFTPEGEFAFQVRREAEIIYDRKSRRWRAYESMAEFVREKEAQGFEVVRRKAGGGPDLGVAWKTVPDPWMKEWVPGGGGDARLTTYFVEGAGETCLTFVTRAADADRFEPAAFRLFEGARLLRRSDPAADDRVPSPEWRFWKDLLWWGGCVLLCVAGPLAVAVPWAAIYCQVVEASRGLPGLQPIEPPILTPPLTVALQALQDGPRGLAAAGFRHEGWFALEDFEETKVSAWRHEGRDTFAYVMYSTVNRTFRLRIVSSFGGSMLVSTTRRTDVAYAPPAGVLVQSRPGATAADLWAWHLEAEALFPAGPPPSASGDTRIKAVPEGIASVPVPAGDDRVQQHDAAADVTAALPPPPPPWSGAKTPVEAFVEVARRWGWHRRRVRFWLLRFEPFGECWRMFWVGGVPLRRQVERGWATLS